MSDSATSLNEVNATVSTSGKTGGWKRLFAFLGPAYLISVGYMDPGNWATDIAGGSRFGYSLIWVLVLSNLIALVLQSLSARLGLVQGLDLAQASRANYSRQTSFFLWIIAEAAIAACDLAEVLGMAIGLQLLFHIPLMYGVGLTVFDTFLLLVLMKQGIRKMEAFILALIAIIGLAFLIQMFLAKPHAGDVIRGLIPSVPNKEALYIAISIIGATVMPHNLYLHSSLVQTRQIRRTIAGIREAIRFNFIDTFIALNLALFVNLAILILAATVFYRNGMFGVEQIQDAYRLLSPVLGHSIAPLIFAVALIAAGQSSTLTGTLSGQIVMEGYLNLRIQPWLRRIITRLIAIIPALLVIGIAGESKVGSLLVFSQVILCLQLGFAVIPLIHFVSDRKTMGVFAISTGLKIISWAGAVLVLLLNVALVYEYEHTWIAGSAHPLIYWVTLVPVSVALGLFLVYLALLPFLKKLREQSSHELHDEHRELLLTDIRSPHRIAVTVDFGSMDSEAISSALAQGTFGAGYMLIHVVETAGARVFHHEVSDKETENDLLKLKQYKDVLVARGYQVETVLGFGNPKDCIPKLVGSFEADLLVMAAHGHKGIMDIIFGTTLDVVRHRVNIPVLIVRPPSERQ